MKKPKAERGEPCKKFLGIYMRESDWLTLTVRARTEQMSMSALVRRVLAGYLKKEASE